MNGMVLTIDIGNTNVTVGVYENDALSFVTRLATDTRRMPAQYALELDQISALYGKRIREADGAIISSVVPELTDVLRQAVYTLTGRQAKILGPGLKSGLNIKIDNPSQLGADLVAGAVAAVAAYPLPCLVIDLGTATKISVLDSAGNYRGCTISAGVGLSLNALAASAAQLPTVNLDVPSCPAFGTNTVSSMQAGILLGTASMLDGLCERIETELGEPVRTIVATGGRAGEIVKHCRKEMICAPDLILDGLYTIYRKNSK